MLSRRRLRSLSLSVSLGRSCCSRSYVARLAVAARVPIVAVVPFIFQGNFPEPQFCPILADSLGGDRLYLFNADELHVALRRLIF